MADFVAVLKKTIDGLPDNNPQARQKIYDRARTTIEAKLRALDPQPPQAVADRQRAVLENAIAEVEAHYAPPPVLEDEPDDGTFDDVFAALEVAPAADPEPPVEAPEPVAAAVLPEVTAPLPQEPEPVDADLQWPPDAPDGRIEPADELAAEKPPLPDPETEPVGELPEKQQDASAAPLPRSRRAGRGIGRWLIAAVVLVALAGSGYALWLNRTDLMAMMPGGEEVASEPASAQEPAAPEAPAAEQAAAEPEPEPAAAPQAPSSTKFTQRLNEDGTEVDMGPAGAPDALGEGTSMAAASQPPAEPAAAPQNTGADSQAVAVGQQAMFYEERTTSAAGTVDRGSTVWSVVQESPGGEQPPEAAIRAEVSIPDRDLQLRLTIRRNADQSLPASHIIEMIFLTPDDFAGGGIDNVLRLTLKPTEEDTGNPLIGIPAKIADGFFLLALSDRPAEQEANAAMMRRQGWIDIPIVYRSGRRALVTLEKGLPGEKAFNDAMDAWQAASSG